jgi:glycosyltransferase involved in cell wall biosynthesis
VKILLGHNSYLFRGGEDTAFELDGRILEDRGHQVVRYVRSNEEILRAHGPARLGIAARTVWNPASAREVAAILRRERPDVAHFENTFPLVSASVYAACRRAGVPVVQSVHNFRPLCVNAFLFRDGRVCEDCVRRRVKWPGVLHACYRGSRAQSAVVAGMTLAHRALGVWHRMVDVIVTVSEFAREKLAAGGLPAERIVVRPNFAYPDPGPRPAGTAGDYLLYVGRLSPEKGVRTLLEAAAAAPGAPLLVVGDGPLRGALERAAAGLGHVRVLGPRPREEALALMRDARALLLPSLWYELSPYVLIEAMGLGVPVIASRIGSLPEWVGDGRAGLLVPPGDVRAWAEALRWVWDHPTEMARMGSGARRVAERRFSPDRGYETLMEAYERARSAAPP